MQGFSEVTTVRVPSDTVRGAAGDAVVDPFPHETTGVAGVGLEGVLVFGEPTGPGTQGVCVLTVQERQTPAAGVEFGLPFRVTLGWHGTAEGALELPDRRFLAPADRLHLADGHVHARVHVGVGTLVVALVVDGSARVTFAGPFGHLTQVLPGTGLVAQGPHDDAGVVLVPLHGPLYPVEVGCAPARVVGRVVPPLHVTETVGFQVALVDHPQAELVAQVEKVGVRRVVAGAYGVDVVLLHEFDVTTHHFLGDRPTVFGVPFVAVDPAQQYAAPVDPEHTAFGAHRTKTDP